MQTGSTIDKARLVMFTDALLAIIMTVLVLDIKVPEGLESMSGEECLVTLFRVFPHFLGFIISFAFILVLWFAHHDLMEAMHTVNKPFTVLNFCFIGSTATLPFSTGLTAAYPTESYAVCTLALNMFIMNVFLAGMFMYAQRKGISRPDFVSLRYQRIKRLMGVGGSVLFFLAIFIAFLSPSIALIMIAIVPIIHCLPVPD